MFIWHTHENQRLGVKNISILNRTDSSDYHVTTKYYYAMCIHVSICRQRYTQGYFSLISIDQSHRYGCHQAACREPAGSYDKTTRTALCFEHKTQYILIRAPYTRIVVFWHISNISPMISQSQISCNTPMFYIAAIFVKYCYTTGSCLL